MMRELSLRMWLDDWGQLLYGVHLHSGECDVFGCAIHCPSEHDRNHLPLYWSNERRMLVRIDEDGSWLTDPDEMGWRRRNPELAATLYRDRTPSA